ncbi:MAG: enoyl-CoA hydratase [Burkholderiales bacterium]|nr:enoyl-CoA hydratase [Burkholderiales bacterium]
MSDIATSRDGGVLCIAFNRPAKKNAITGAMYQALADALKAADADAGVRAVLFEGGADIFTAGNDLEDFMHHPPSGNDSPVFQFLYNLSHAKKPLLAAVAGAAVGVGTTMLLHCDAVYAADNARFSMPFVTLGLCPEAASSLLLPALCGYQRAAEKLLFGEPFDAAEAREMGLVNKVLPAAELAAFARARAHKLAALPASSVRTTKALMRGTHVKAVEAQMTEEGAHFRKMLSSPEAKEAFAAFFERRKPDFSRFA